MIITPLASGTRLRIDHNTFAEVVTSFAVGTKLEGSELWIASADGTEVKAGDKWLFVLKSNGVTLPKAGWVAVIHKGVSICKIIDATIPSVPPTTPPANDGVKRIVKAVITYETDGGQLLTKEVLPES